MWLPDQERTLRDGLAVLAMASAPSSAHGASTCFPPHLSEVCNLRANAFLGKARWTMDFPGGSAGKESACNAGDPGLIPGSERCPGEGNGYPLQYSYPENSMDRAAWWAAVLGVTESRTWLSDQHTHTHTRELHGHNCYSWKMSSQTKEWKPRETINHPLLLELSISRFWPNQGDREPPNSHKKQESFRNQDSAVQIKQFKTWIRPSLIIYCCPSTTLHNCAGWTLNSLGSTISNITDREFCIDCKLLQVECDKVSWWRDAIF